MLKEASGNNHYHIQFVLVYASTSIFCSVILFIYLYIYIFFVLFCFFFVCLFLASSSSWAASVDAGLDDDLVEMAITEH